MAHTKSINDSEFTITHTLKFQNNLQKSSETKEYRNIILKNYPYVITYSIQKNRIKIINIIHKKQNSKSRQQI